MKQKHQSSSPARRPMQRTDSAPHSRFVTKEDEILKQEQLNVMKRREEREQKLHEHAIKYMEFLRNLYDDKVDNVAIRKGSSNAHRLKTIWKKEELIQLEKNMKKNKLINQSNKIRKEITENTINCMAADILRKSRAKLQRKEAVPRTEAGLKWRTVG